MKKFKENVKHFSRKVQNEAEHTLGMESAVDYRVDKVEENIRHKATEKGLDTGGITGTLMVKGAELADVIFHSDTPSNTTITEDIQVVGDTMVDTECCGIIDSCVIL